MPVIPVVEGHLIGIGMDRTDIMNLDLNVHPGVSHPFTIMNKAFVVSLPAEKTAKQTHVGSLAFVGRGQGSRRMEFYPDPVQVPIHQIPGHEADAQRRRAMRAGGTPHHGPDDIIEDARSFFHRPTSADDGAALCAPCQ